MQPNHTGLSGARESHVSYRGSSTLQDQPLMSAVPSFTKRLRSEDSWVDISSQPSSSSLSSAGDNDIVTAGVHVRQELDSRRQRRRRRLHTSTLVDLRLPARSSSGGGSSQEEYDESESESDRIMNSSNEDLAADGAGAVDSRALRDHEDDDDSSTALGTRASFSDEVFTPQPNAFSHPPSNCLGMRSTPTPNSYFPRASSTNHAAAYLSSNQASNPGSSRPSRPPILHPYKPRSRATCNIIGPSHTYQPDHDAALRASLSTLLSCAAAVRGESPKQQDAAAAIDNHQQNERTMLRLIPESDLYGHRNEQAPPPLPPRRPRAKSPNPPTSRSLSPKAATKRKARESSKDRHTKKSRATRTVASGTMDEATVSPVLMSWMISAGVVLVFSAISFSIGYAWGKEIGRLEGSTGIVNGEGTTTACGKEAIRSGSGLRKLRWGTASTNIRV